MIAEPGMGPVDEAQSPSRAWLVIFTDLVSLMLTFFVLLFSMSSVQIDRWKEMVDTLSQSLNPAVEKATTPVSAQYNIATFFRKRAVNLDYLGSVLEDVMRRDPLLARSQFLRLEERLIIALPGDLLFAPGQAGLSDRAREAIFALGGILRNIGNQIVVNGHTDPGAAGTGSYPSSWELSLARATAVANSLRRSGYTEDITAYGYGDSRFAELPDVVAAERMALARRVDIVVLPTVGG